MPAPALIAEWQSRHSDCSTDTAPTSHASARYVLTSHAGHGPTCLQTLAAGAYLSEGNSDDE